MGAHQQTGNRPEGEMAANGGARLMEMMFDDRELRRAFRSDPTGVAQRIGGDLDEDARAALASWEELLRRLRRLGTDDPAAAPHGSHRSQPPTRLDSWLSASRAMGTTCAGTLH